MVACPRRRRAFTLVELLVVITIIGILVALTLPAVQSARESARSKQCANHVKQIVLALHMYHASQDELPENTEISGYADTAVDCSWMSLVLPYVEEQPLFSQINFAQPVGQGPNVAADQSVVSTFRCPDDNTFPTGRLQGDYTASCCDDNRWWIGIGGAITNYKACAGANWCWGDFDVSQPGGFNSDNCDGLDHGNGIIYRDWSSQPSQRFDDIKDGLSNTFAVGEAVGGFCAWNNWRWSNGCTATCAMPLNYRATMDLHAVWDDWSRSYSFFSQHPGGANFGMCDGRVCFVNDFIDINVYRGLATIAFRRNGPSAAMITENGDWSAAPPRAAQQGMRFAK